VERPGRLTSLPITSGLIYRLSFIIRPFLTIHEKATRNWARAREERRQYESIEESIVSVPDRTHERNASTPRHVAADYLSDVCIQSVSLRKETDYYIETPLERGRKRGGSALRSRRERRTIRFLLAPASIRFRGQIDAESKIALRANGTDSSITSPRKRFIARRQAIGLVQTDARAKDRDRLFGKYTPRERHQPIARIDINNRVSTSVLDWTRDLIATIDLIATCGDDTHNTLYMYNVFAAKYSGHCRDQSG
jgi:hypothetical protein